MAVKQLGQPEPREIAQLEEYVHETLYQGDAPERIHFVQSAADHSVRLSMLYWSDELDDPEVCVQPSPLTCSPGPSPEPSP